MPNIDDKTEIDSDKGIDTPKRKWDFLINLFTRIENFSKHEWFAKKEKKSEVKAEKKEKKKELEDSKTTIQDVHNQRKNHVKQLFIKLMVGAFISLLVISAIILAFQDNEQQNRKNIEVKKILKDTTSFGGIDQKDYFLEQNVLDDKISIVEKKAEKGRKELNGKILEQTEIITAHMDKKLTELSDKQTKELEDTKESILKIVDKKIEDVSLANTETQKKIGSLSKKVDGYKNAPRLGLTNGKIIFPSNNSRVQETPTVINPIKTLNSNTDDKNEIVEYEMVEVDMSAINIPELTFDTGMEDVNQSVEKKIEFDLTTTLVRITLINGIKAPTLDIGVKNPTPVLMSVDGIAYAANDQTSGVLKGCLLRGVAIGNINTSRAEIFGTHLSCILEGDSGDLYKVEHTFPDNEVWIKGEDGADGVSGLIVDSSGKILAKSAAIGFMQGLTNYFSAQNLVTGGLGTVNNTNQSTVAQLGTSMQSGAGQGLSTGFDLIIQKYEEILGGYYPFIDVKGGRKNLTAIFGGNVKLVATPYQEAHLENY